MRRLRMVGFALRNFFILRSFSVGGSVGGLLAVGGLLVVAGCSDGGTADQSTSSTDSIPADLAVINAEIEKDRNNSELYFKRARYYLSNKDIGNALTDMGIVLKMDSTHAKPYLFLADLYLMQNKTRDTRDMLRKAILVDSSNTEALKKYSELFYLLRQYDTAMFYVNRSLHYDRANASAHFQKGMILKEVGDTAKAITSFQDAVKSRQDYYSAVMQLGVILLAKNDPLALQYLDNALRIDPHSIEALYAKGSFFQGQKDYENAIKTYDQILEIAPEHQDATFNIGACLFEQKKYDEAMAKFDLTLKRDENFFRGHYGKGRCFEAKGEKKQAIESYQRCLALRPDYQLALTQMSIITKRKG